MILAMFQIARREKSWRMKLYWWVWWSRLWLVDFSNVNWSTTFAISCKENLSRKFPHEEAMFFSFSLCVLFKVWLQLLQSQFNMLFPFSIPCFRCLSSLCADFVCDCSWNARRRLEQGLSMCFCSGLQQLSLFIR